MFWVISVQFNIRNTLPKSGTFLLGHPVYIEKNCASSWSFTMNRNRMYGKQDIKLPNGLLHRTSIRTIYVVRQPYFLLLVGCR